MDLGGFVLAGAGGGYLMPTLVWLVVILALMPVIRWALYWVALGVCSLGIIIWRSLSAPKFERRAVMEKAGTKGLVGRRVEYLEEDLRPVGGTIKAVHNWRGRRRFFVSWDDKSPRDSFIHEGHPLLTIKA